MENDEGTCSSGTMPLIRSLALSRDGRLLACGDMVGRVWIFDWVQ